MGKLKTCDSCGAEYKDNLPKCPYCGTMNYKGAEAEYLEKLENVREDMADLGAVPAEETKRELRRQGKFLKKILLGIAGLAIVTVGMVLFMNREPERDVQADYLWRQENFPVLDELYEQEKYEELLTMLWEALEENAPVNEWEHVEFCWALNDLLMVEMTLDAEALGEELSEYDYRQLLYCGWKVESSYWEDTLQEEEWQRLWPYAERLSEDFDTRWNFTEEERAAFEAELQENFGLISYDTCVEYIEKWLKEKRQDEM